MNKEIINILIEFRYEYFRSSNWISASAKHIQEGNSKSQSKTISFSGLVPIPMNKGFKYELTGFWEEHPKYGKTFKMNASKIVLTEEKENSLAFLSSNLFKGIGNVAAKKIVAAFDEKYSGYDENGVKRKRDFISELQKDEELLSKTIGPKKAKKIIETIVSSEQDVRINKLFGKENLDQSVLDTLRKEGFTGSSINDLLTKNFYEFSFENDLFSFAQIDPIVRVFDLESYLSDRNKWLVLSALKSIFSRTGNTRIKLEELLRETIRIIPHNLFKEIIEDLQNKNLIKIFDDEITLSIYYETEFENAQIILNSLKKTSILPEYLEEKIERTIKEVEAEIGSDFHYDEEQIDAIYAFLKNNILVLQGGAGVGKSKVVQGMTKIYQKLTGKVSTLLAPTGKAANRLNEIDPKFNAKTIHSFFRESKTSLVDHFKNKKKHKAKKVCSVIIIDESSMLDIFTLNMILTNSIWEKIVFVGDINQLPSVSVGDVLWDMNLSKKIKIAKLNTIHRNSSDSGIITLATKIKNNEIKDISDLENIPNITNKLGQGITENIDSYINEMIKNNVSFDDFQVLSPVYETPQYIDKNSIGSGINDLNQFIQKKYHKASDYNIKKIIKRSGKDVYFMAGDKILFLKNDPDTLTTNGETGSIKYLEMKNVSTAKTTIINSFIKNKDIRFEGNDIFSDIALGYACSIHKSQGSEYSEVAVVIGSNCVFLDRRNIYTAITRSKHNALLLGDPAAFISACQREPLKRKTFLLEFLEQ